jgi:apolipoprotein N-acyltransferase
MVSFKRKLQAAGAGVVIGSGFIVPEFIGVSLVALSYTAWQLYRQSWRLPELWLVFFIKYLVVLVWFWSVYPIDWLPVPPGVIPLVLIGFYWTAAAVFLSVGAFALYGLLTATRALAPRAVLYLLPVYWLLGELIGAISFSIFTYGAGATINASFSFGFIGYLLAASDVWLPLARVAGVYGLSVAVAGVGLLVAYMVSRRPSVGLVVGSVLVSTLYIPTSSLVSPVVNSETTVTVAVVDTAFPNNAAQQTPAVFAEKRQEAIRVALASTPTPDYILLPEDARAFDHTLNAQSLAALLRFQYPGNDTQIIDSSRVDYQSGAVLQAAVYDQQTSTILRADKRYLVPQGEFMPTAFAVVLRAVGLGETVKKVARQTSYVVGENTSQADFSSNTPGVLFCFESVSPMGVRTLLRERATLPFVAHPVSHSWFNNTQFLQPQLDTMLRTQAVWNQVPIVSAGSHNRGYLVTPKGVIVYPDTLIQAEDWQVGIVSFVVSK